MKARSRRANSRLRTWKVRPKKSVFEAERKQRKAEESKRKAEKQSLKLSSCDTKLRRCMRHKAKVLESEAEEKQHTAMYI